MWQKTGRSSNSKIPMFLIPDKQPAIKRSKNAGIGKSPPRSPRELPIRGDNAGLYGPMSRFNSTVSGSELLAASDLGFPICDGSLGIHCMELSAILIGQVITNQMKTRSLVRVP